jgi:hypothetical protein
MPLEWVNFVSPVKSWCKAKFKRKDKQVKQLKQLRLCKDCKYYTLNKYKDPEFAKCACPQIEYVLNPITGVKEPKFDYCSIQRRDIGSFYAWALDYCGASGRYFQPKPIKEPDSVDKINAILNTPKEIVEDES